MTESDNIKEGEEEERHSKSMSLDSSTSTEVQYPEVADTDSDEWSPPHEILWCTFKPECSGEKRTLEDIVPPHNVKRKRSANKFLEKATSVSPDQPPEQHLVVHGTSRPEVSSINSIMSSGTTGSTTSAFPPARPLKHLEFNPKPGDHK